MSCVYHNTVGEKKTASLHLLVNFSPSSSSSPVQVRRGGRGLSMDVACEVEGQPTPKVTWYKGEEVCMEKTFLKRETNCFNSFIYFLPPTYYEYFKSRIFCVGFFFLLSLRLFCKDAAFC